MGISEYEQKWRNLAKKAFCLSENGELDTLTGPETRMLDYVLLSGAYGTQKQRIQNILRSLGSEEEYPSLKTRWKYLFQRAFPDKAFMDLWTRMYCPWSYRRTGLYPFIRIWRLFYKGIAGFGRIRREIRTVFRC